MGESWSLAGNLFSRFRSAAPSPTVALSGALPTPTCPFPLHTKPSGQASPLCDPRAPPYPQGAAWSKVLRVVSHPDLSGGPQQATPRAQRGRTGPCRWGELRPGIYLERAGRSAGHQSRRRRSSSIRLPTRANSVPPGRILSHGSRQSCQGEAQPGRHRLTAPVTAAAAAATAAAATHTPSVQRRWRGPALWGLPGAQPATVLPGTEPRKQRPGSPASSKPAPGRRS